MKGLIQTLTESTVWSLLVQCFIWIALFLAPISISMGIVLFLIASDMVFGTWASLGVKKKPFSSRALRRTGGKIFIYEFLVVFAHVLQKQVWPEYELVKGTMSFISIVESISILEHIKTITKIDVWAFFFHRVNKNTPSGKFLFKLKQKNTTKRKKKS